MILEELMHERFATYSFFKDQMAVYAGLPAVFYQGAPDDRQKGWEGEQYPRIVYTIDMQADEERKSAGVMQVDLYCDERKTLPEDIEPYIRKCLVNLIVKPEGNSHYAFAWARTEMFGSGGTQASITLKDDADADVVTLTTLYPTSRAFTVTIKESLEDDTQKMAIIQEGTKDLETVTFAAGSAEVAGIIAAFTNSAYVKAVKKADGSGKLKTISQSKFTGGTDPTVNTEAYDAGFEASEEETYAVKIYNTEDELTAVQFYMNPMSDEEFSKVAGKGRGTMIYALHSRKVKVAG